MDTPAPADTLDGDAPDLLRGQPPDLMAGSVERINAADGGLLSVLVARFQDLPGLLEASLRGEPQAVAVMRNMTYTAQRIAVSAPGHQPECAACAVPVTGGTFSCVTVTAGDLGVGICAVVCSTCGPPAAAHDELRRMALPMLRDAFPGLRLLPPIHPTVGRA